MDFRRPSFDGSLRCFSFMSLDSGILQKPYSLNFVEQNPDLSTVLGSVQHRDLVSKDWGGV